MGLKKHLQRAIASVQRPTTWADVIIEGITGIVLGAVGFITDFLPLRYVGGFYLIQTLLDAWYTFRPPKGTNLRQYAKDVFEGKINPEEDK